MPRQRPRGTKRGGRPDMGRGRAKAKQTKVARNLKYRSFDTDFASLQRELNAKQRGTEAEEDTIPEAYLDLAEKYAEAEKDDYDDLSRSR